MASPKSSELASALAEIDARGLDRVALIVPFELDPADLVALAAAPSVRWVAQRGRSGLVPDGGPELIDDDGASVPDGTLHILFVGPWRSLPPPLLRAARKLRVANLLCRVGTRWRHPPTVSHLLKAIYYRGPYPVLAPPARAARHLGDLYLWRPVSRRVSPLCASCGAEIERLRQRVRTELMGRDGEPAKPVLTQLPRVLRKVLRYGAVRLQQRLAKYRPNRVAILRHKALRLGRRAPEGMILAPTFPLPPAEISSFLASPGVKGLVLMHGPPLDGAQDPRLGAWIGDAWILPQAARRVYVVGRWRALGRRALVSAIERPLDGVFLSLGPLWVPLPLRTLRLLLKLRRIMPDPWLNRGLFRRALADVVPMAGFVPGRVVVVCGSLAPGGAERQVANTLVGLAGRGLSDIHLLCDYLAPNQPSRYDFYLPLLRRASIATREIEVKVTRVDPDSAELPEAFRRAARHMPPNLAADIANLYVEFRALRPEVVHAFLDWSSVRAGMAAALAGVPRIVLSGRNVNPSHFALYQRYMDPVYQALAARPDVSLINNSEAGARDYEAWLGLPRGRIGILRNGVDFGGSARASPPAIAATRAALGVPDGAALVGGVFRLFPEKRPMLWVDAAAEIARHDKTVHFVIYGQGVLEHELRDHIRACGLEDRLVLAGVTGDVLSVLSALDVFMLTSFKEGTPNVVLEAQWVGTPVVAVEAGGTREALEPGRTGWIVDPPTPTALADRVLRLLADPELRAACRSAGPAFIETQFGLGRMVDETLAAYGFDARIL
jgi:glycosyltransferase involved in cell wall biosynthesis